jgi:glucokinase
MSDSPLTVGIDFGGTSVKLAVVFQSHIVDHAPPIATQEFDGPEKLIDEIVRSVEDLRIRHSGIAAVGVGMPGFVNFVTGVVFNLTNVAGWAGFPLKMVLEQRIGLPVVVDNDANCMAVAEWKCGAGRGFQNVIFISLGTGVGGGVIVNGQMVRGAHYGAGEIGQMSIDYQGSSGNYGNLGALEKYVGNQQIAEFARDAYTAAGIQKSIDECSPAAMANAAHRDDAIAQALWKDVGRKLATGVMNCCWLLNPDAIVIGGGVARAGALLLRPFEEHLYSQLSGPFKDHLRVVPALFGHEAGAIGAAALAREAIVSAV